MIHNDEIDEVAIEEVENEQEPTGFELDAILIERAAAEAADLEEERHKDFMDRVRAWARDDGNGNGIEIPGNLINGSRDAIDEYFAGCYRTAHPPRTRRQQDLRPGPARVGPRDTTPQQPTVRSAQGVRPLGLPIRPTPPEPPPEPGYKPPIGTAGGFKARAARTTRVLPANFSGPVGLPEMIPSDRWEIP